MLRFISIFFSQTEMHSVCYTAEKGNNLVCHIYRSLLSPRFFNFFRARQPQNERLEEASLTGKEKHN